MPLYLLISSHLSTSLRLSNNAANHPLTTIPIAVSAGSIRLRPFCIFILDVNSDTVLPVSALQSAMFFFVNAALPNIVESRTVGRVCMTETTDLPSVLEQSFSDIRFIDQRIPALLIEWRSEVKALMIQRASSASSKKSAASSRSGVRVPDMLIVFRPANKIDNSLLVLHSMELKVYNVCEASDVTILNWQAKNKDKISKWRKGMAGARHPLSSTMSRSARHLLFLGPSSRASLPPTASFTSRSRPRT